MHLYTIKFNLKLGELDLTEPAHVSHDSYLIIEKILFKRTSLSSVLAYVMVGTKTHLVVNSNVADKHISAQTNQ